MQLEIHQQKAIELLLKAECERDFQRQVTNIDFLSWLHNRELISSAHFDLQLKETRKKNGTTTEIQNDNGSRSGD